MARDIVKDYIEYAGKYLKEYKDIIKEKKLNSKISDMIIDTYINVRYYDIYEHVKDYPIDNIEYYIIENFKKNFNDKNREKNIPLVTDVLIILRYVFLYEKYSKDKTAIKQLTGYEDKLKVKYDNTKIIIIDLIKMIKENARKKEKFLNNLLSNDFNIAKNETNIKKVFDLFFDNSVKIPDLFSDVAINRVYNSGIINEDKMTVFYLLTEREILIDMKDFNNDNNYLVEFPHSLIGKRNKLNALFKLMDSDYLKERMIFKVLYSDYLDKKDDYDKLIHSGYSLAVIVNEEVENTMLLNIFTYIMMEGKKYKNIIKEFDNVIFI